MAHCSQPFWLPETIPPQRCVRAQVGLLRTWVLHTADQAWHVYTQAQAVPGLEPLHDAEPPPDAPWVRFVTPSPDFHLRLVPALPDAAVVIRPAVPLEILPGGTAQIYVSIPCWLQIWLGENATRPLCEYPTKPLSKTWFGANTQSGELCYSIRTRARRTVEEISSIDGRIVLPINIRNASAENLPFSRLCIHAPRMSVYGTPDGKLWANQTTFIHHAGTKSTELRLGTAAPEQAQHATLLCPPRAIPQSHALRDLFSFL